MVKALGRRKVLALLAAGMTMPRALRAEDIVDLQWNDLLPRGAPPIPRELQSLVDHTGPNLSSLQPPSSGLRADWNGEVVRLPGFIVPIDMEGTAVTAFILVPYAGACIHVPPPPANQLVFVTTSDPYESKGLYEPVHVTGMFGASSISTHLADIGYALSADKVEPFRS